MVIGPRIFIGFETIGGEMANSVFTGINLLIGVFFHLIVGMVIGVFFIHFDGIGVLANLEFAKFKGVTVVKAVFILDFVTGVPLNS